MIAFMRRVPCLAGSSVAVAPPAALPCRRGAGFPRRTGRPVGRAIGEPGVLVRGWRPGHSVVAHTRCAMPRRSMSAMMRISPPPIFGSMPWRTAFSTSGCTSIGGKAIRGRFRRFDAPVQALAKADLEDGEISFRASRFRRRASLDAARADQRDAQPVVEAIGRSLASAGRLSIRLLTLASVLNRKCGFDLRLQQPEMRLDFASFALALDQLAVFAFLPPAGRRG